MTQNASKAAGGKGTPGITLFSPGSDQHGEFATFSFLSKQVPQPFQAEFSGGMGQVIHDKFVVVDFNGDNPVVFTGSSNLADGGEQANRENLLAIRDRDVTSGYPETPLPLAAHSHSLP